MAGREKPKGTVKLGKVVEWWARGWVTFARSAGGRAEDLVGPSPWASHRKGKDLNG